MAERYDLVIIGAGPAGYVAAIRAAQLGMRVVCIEKSQTLGGTCLNVGCIPSKALLQSTEYFDLIRRDGRIHGIDFDNASYNFLQMMQRKEEVVESLTDGIASLFKKNKVEWIHGEASFVDAHTLKVGEQEIAGDFILIATGSEPVELPFLPFDDERIVSSTGALSLKEVPEKMIVIGAGVIGVELGSVYRRLGCEVTFIEMLDRITPTMDRTICKTFLQILKKQGLTFHLGAKVLSGSKDENGVTLQVQLPEGEQDFSADVVLVAVGRRPYSKGLNLDEIDIATNRHGQIIIDGMFRTSREHIYAVGDIVDGPMLAHKASEEGMAAVEVIAGETPHINYIAIPNVVYTHPEVACVGLTEEEATGEGLSVFTGTAFFKGNPRARCSHDTDGLVKLVGDEKSGALLGMHIVGPHASEMIGEAVIALEKRMTIEELAYASHAHPTLSEAIKDAAFAALKRPIHG